MKTSKRRSPLVRWSPRLKKLRALSLRQPWAWLVVNGYKDIENRSWRTNHRGPLLIHASQSRADFTPEKLAVIEQKYGVDVPWKVEFGGMVGDIDVLDCAKKHSSNGKFRAFISVLSRSDSHFRPASSQRS